MSPVDMLRSWFDAHARGDLDAARRLVVDDLEIDVDGARLRGFDAFMDWYAERRRTQPSFSYEVEDLLGGERHAAAVLNLSDGQRRWRQVALYELNGERISQIWLREDD